MNDDAIILLPQTFARDHSTAIAATLRCQKLEIETIKVTDTKRSIAQAHYKCPNLIPSLIFIPSQSTEQLRQRKSKRLRS
jgi:hypothetical protein